MIILKNKYIFMLQKCNSRSNHLLFSLNFKRFSVATICRHVKKVSSNVLALNECKRVIFKQYGFDLSLNALCQTKIASHNS